MYVYIFLIFGVIFSLSMITYSTNYCPLIRSMNSKHAIMTCSVSIDINCKTSPFFSFICFFFQAIWFWNLVYLVIIYMNMQINVDQDSSYISSAGIFCRD